MNAKELGLIQATLESQGNLIKQQADRIAELEKLLEHSVGSDCREMRYIQEIENKDAQIAELEKQLQESAMHNISVTSQADEHYARVKELENELHMIQRHYDQLYTQLHSQTKQSEPVAWMQMHYKDNIPTKFSPVKVWEDDIPLYTTPQTKPLSDEEIEEVAKIHLGHSMGLLNWHGFARAIEAKVRGEK